MNLYPSTMRELLGYLSIPVIVVDEVGWKMSVPNKGSAGIPNYGAPVDAKYSGKMMTAHSTRGAGMEE